MAAIAQAAGPSITPDDVSIDKIEPLTSVRRRLLATEGIRVEFSIRTTDQSTANTIASSLTEDNVNSALKTAGLPEATVIQSATAVAADGQAESTLPLGGPGGVLGLTISLTVVFLAAIAFATGGIDFTGQEKKIIVQDIFDCALDWASFAGAYGTGDLDFSNDRGRVIFGFLIFIAIVGMLLFMFDLYCFLAGRGMNRLVFLLKFGVEDFAQVIIYSIVIASQAEGGRQGWGMFAGLVQSLFFCFLKFYEMWSMKGGGAVSGHGSVHPIRVPDHGATVAPAMAGGSSANGSAPAQPSSGGGTGSATPTLTHQESMDQHTCVICLSERARYVVVPCGHKCLCQSCADTSRVQACPMCRGRVQSVMRVYG